MQLRLPVATIALTCTLLAVSLTVSAQQAPKKTPRVGIVLTTTPLSEMAGPRPIHPLTRAFVERLRELGYVEGQTIVVERRSAEGRFDRFDGIVAELLRLDVSVIVTTGDAMTKRAKELTATVPIVMAASWFPVEEGLVSSLARPGGNVTGVTVDAGPEIEAKRLAVLAEAVSRVSRRPRVALLGMKADWEILEVNLRDAAAALRVSLLRAEHTPNDYVQAFDAITRNRPDALFVVKNAPNYAQRQQIIDFAARRRLPATYPTREFVGEGGLMAYGISVVDLYRRSAEYVDKILRGAKPADLPVERPTKFELVINLKTAKALGLTIAPSVLVRADQIIE